MKIVKNIKSVVVMSLLAFTLSSCSGKVDDVLSDMQVTVAKRINWNIEQLTRLKNVGLVTDAMYDGLVTNINSRLGKITNTDNTNLDSNVANFIKPALSYIMSTSGSPFSGVAGADNLAEYPTFKTYVENIGSVSSYLGSNKGNPSVDSKKVTPLEIFSTKNTTKSSGGQDINEILNSRIYVLNADLVGTDLSDLAIAMKTIKELKDKTGLSNEERDKLAKARGWLSNFKETDMSLLDGSTSLTRITKPNAEAYKVATGSGIPESKSDESLNNPLKGEDLAIFSSTVPVMAIRLQELDDKVIDALLKEINDAGDSYLIDYVDGDANKGARVYRMFYPVSYVDTVKYDSTNKKANIISKKSDLITVNIMTGQVNLAKDNDYYSAEELKSIEAIYNVLGNSDNESSFTIWDKAKTKEKHNGIESDVESNTILLKDYLEYTYLPTFIKDEPFVALGRKVRLYGIEKDGTFKDTTKIGKFIDKTGFPITGAEPIKLDDLVDRKSGNKDNEKTAIKLDNLDGTKKENSSETSKTPIYIGGQWESEVYRGGVESFAYKNKYGNYIRNGWAWIDANKDGKAECYKFVDGVLVTSEIKDEDSAIVNRDGQWIQNGEIQYKTVSESDETKDTSTKVEINIGSSTGLASDVNKARFEKTVYKSEISPVSEFPNNSSDNSVAKVDGKENGGKKSRLIHYGIFLNTDLYRTQLYSGWLNVNGEGSGGSLTWWNEWLKKAKFSYSIDKNKLAEYLNVNFIADTTGDRDNTIVLDANTLGAIQSNLLQEKRIEQITLVRTLLVGLGFFCFVYGALLLVAWVIDTSTMIEINLFTLLTFGKCVAIVDSVERPVSDLSGKAYLTFNGVLLRLIALVGLGLVLINVDFLGLVGRLYDALKGITDFVQKGFFGK